MNKAYKYKLYPDGEQEKLINKAFASVRYMHNKMLAKRKRIIRLFTL